MASSSMSRPRQCGSPCRAHGEQTHSWSRSGIWSWPCDSSCTWSRPGGSSWPCGPCTRWRASWCPSKITSLGSCSSSSTIPCRRLQFIDRVGHCSHATVIGILVQTVQKTVEIRLSSSLARLFTSRCCATTGAMVRQCCPVEVPLLQFIDSRQHPVVVVQTVLVELPQLQFIDSRRHSNCGADVAVLPQVQLRLWTSLCSCSDGLFNSSGASDSVHRQSLSVGTQLSEVVLWW